MSPTQGHWPPQGVPGAPGGYGGPAYPGPAYPAPQAPMAYGPPQAGQAPLADAWSLYPAVPPDLAPVVPTMRFDDVDISRSPIVLRNVTKTYGTLLGLNEVSLVLRPGITAVVGPNGSGKSTLFKLIAGLSRPNKGVVTVLGEDPFNNPRVMSTLGFCPDYDAFYPTMTGLQYLTFMARLHGLSPTDAIAEAEWALQAVELDWVSQRQIRTYSRGMRQRVKIAQSILTDPQVLILDEPFNGTDPLTKASLRQLFLRWAREGRSLLVSSHVLHEVETLTRNVIVLARGRVVAEGDVGVVRSLIDTIPHRVWVETDYPRELGALLVQLPYVVSVAISVNPRGLSIMTHQPQLLYVDLPKVLVESRIRIRHIGSPDDNLDSLFRALAQMGGFY